MRYYGTWGAVCADYFDLQDANVVCRMMGYSQAATIYKQVHSDSMFSFSLVMHCNGHERSITQCTRYNLYRINACGSNNDVWIVCKPAGIYFYAL
jgi:deleted-in-malignant-brain-tumors protein 1